MATAIITRPVPALAAAKKTYLQTGLDVFLAPVFDILSNPSVAQSWLRMPADIWVVLSVNALTHALKIDPKLKPGNDTRVLAVGPAVAKAWETHFNQVIEYHPLMNSEGVVELLKAHQPQSVQILTTGEGRDTIKSHCMNHSISFRQINTYVRVPLSLDLRALEALYRRNEPTVLTATSSDILSQYVKQLPAQLKSQTKSSPLIVGAQRIADLAADLGFSEVVLAPSPSDHDMVDAVSNHLNQT